MKSAGPESSSEKALTQLEPDRVGSKPGDDIGIGGTDTLVDERLAPNQNLAPTDNGDHERFAHYVRKAKLTQSMVEGKALRALCGKKWIPSRDPEKFPICPKCLEIYNGLKKE
jgi:hypothetical protein